MKTFGDEVLFAWPVRPAQRVRELEDDPRSREELHAELELVKKEMRRVRARLEFVEDENHRLRARLFAADDDDDDDEEPLALLVRTSPG